MTVSAADQSDVAGITELWNLAIRDSAVTFESVARSVADVSALVTARRASGEAVLVARGAGGLAGFATYAQFRGGTGYRRTMEHSIHVAPGLRGGGVGRALMTALLSHAAARDVHSMVAGISGENPSALAFHAALGFSPVGVLPQAGRKFGRWMDLHLMMKSVTRGPDSPARAL